MIWYDPWSNLAYEIITGSSTWPIMWKTTFYPPARLPRKAKRRARKRKARS